MNRVAPLAAAALLLGTIQAPAIAADLPALSKEQQEHAVVYFGVLASAMRSDKIEEPVKAALMGCIYSNPLSAIAGAIDKAIDGSNGKVDRADPNAVLGVMVGVCGYKPTKDDATPPPPSPQAQSAGAIKGR